MKIGVVSSGNENLSLFSLLQKFDAQYIVYYDSAQWPYDDKNFDQAVSAVQVGIDYLVSQGCVGVVIHPVFELFFALSGKHTGVIVPLFQGYLDVCFASSHVGKIAVYGDHMSLSRMTELLPLYAKNYHPSSVQHSTKTFLSPFAWWYKEVPLWNYMLRSLSPREYMVNKLLKHDLTYAKNANVDTVIPLQYSYFSYTRTIQNFLNQRKHRFHDISLLAKVFTQRFAQHSDGKTDYSVSLFATGSTHMLDQTKLLKQLMARGDYANLSFLSPLNG